MQQLLERGIATRRGVMCAHREPAYPRSAWRCTGGDDCLCGPYRWAALARSEEAQDHSIIIPLFPQMTATQQDRVVEALSEILSS